MITNEKERNNLEERINQIFNENERKFLKETEIDIVGAVIAESKYSNENERVEEIVDEDTILLHIYAIVIDWHIYLGIQQCKQASEKWKSEKWEGKYSSPLAPGLKYYVSRMLMVCLGCPELVHFIHFSSDLTKIMNRS